MAGPPEGRVPGVVTSGSQDHAEKVAARYPLGSAVEVHYDPDHPRAPRCRGPCQRDPDRIGR
jgi:hypothetical protein